ncbi:AraC-like DNA-binding protein [Kineococcus radiotolerans]|uniref:AraC-like DNA-binding protein n=1 Tax=Kineococcus radiotolerans TaxID=131568 RepID=A0A7W4TQC6_KINRA|nr:AraC family transcriptional regulator [Kineococcus radiotolerans]MBB2903158.1 AraC-like DNA-binding protein [Kineococcus radiotolerans]
MDDHVTSGAVVGSPEVVRDGFAGQRMFVLAPPVITAALARPVTRRLLVTDAGFFPRAAHHGRSRPHGAGQSVLLVCTEGSGWCRTPEGSYSVQRGDAVLLPATGAHEYAASEEDPWTLWWLHCTGSDVEDLVWTARAAAGGPVSHLRDPGSVAAFVSAAIDALDAGTAGGLVQASGAAWHALTEVIATGRRPRGPSSSPVERALEHLRATTPRRTSVQELAAMVGLRPSQLGTLFRQQIGTSPLRYQSDLRMARARELLDSTDLSVAEIARTCGYEDPLYFSRQFSNTHTQSPTAFRTRAR